MGGTLSILSQWDSIFVSALTTTNTILRTFALPEVCRAFQRLPT